ncbi:MAG: glycosyltransferase family 4 protein [Elstera sp.]
MKAVFVYPGDLDQPTGGYRYDAALLREWASAGVSVTAISLPGSYPDPSEADLAAAEALLAPIPADVPILIDGLAFAVLPGAWLDRLGKRWQALIHHPLCLETGLHPARAATLEAKERDALSRAELVVVTSRATGETLRTRFAVPETKILLAPPGIIRYPRAAPHVPPMILSVGAISPRKNFDGLVEALATVQDLAWTATIVGSDAHSPETGSALRAQIAALGLADRITLTGALTGPALEEAYASASFYVHAAHYEGFGMALADALASGLPTVASTGGAVGDWLPEGAALRATPDAASLAQNLRRLLTDADLANRLAAAGRAIDFPTWAGSAAKIAERWI